jgi:CheY-like chemotaxis protein
MDEKRFPQRAYAANGQSSSQPARAWRILIVEDDADTADLMAQLLRREGCSVHVAANGPEALRAAEADHPEVVLLDLGLPGMSGYDVAKGLRAQKSEKRPLLIAVTGHGGQADRLQSYESGIDLHLTKPVDIAELRQYLDRFDSATAPAH